MESETFYEKLSSPETTDFQELLDQSNDVQLTTLALAHEGLAYVCGDRLQASIHVDQAMQAFRTIIEIGVSEGNKHYPSLPLVYAKAHLNLEPLFRNLIINQQISQPEEVEQAYQPFIRDLAAQARSAKPFLNGPEPKDKALWHQFGGLAAAFNAMATAGLLFRFQVRDLRNDDWMVLPAFLEPDMINPESTNPITGLWHLNVYGGTGNEIERLYKAYIRSRQISVHEEMADPTTSVIWLSPDLAVPGERGNVSPLTIIDELSNERGKKIRLDLRIKQLLVALDQRNYGMLKRG